ncbi:hypothetical protein OG978_38425 [Streptomyces sp. NBC_01591]|nr:hypothetical protein [Streptomyces sp. NBC_01591]WSD72738.1 hypothetical protein OG978_38425 [Streptomyces sp. NBC_01591]
MGAFAVQRRVGVEAQDCPRRPDGEQRGGGEDRARLVRGLRVSM